MKKWLAPLIACTLILTPLLPTAPAGAVATSPAAQSLSIKDIVHYSDRMVKIHILNDKDKEVGTGSGFLVTSDGEIVTNYHVVEKGVKLKIELSNKQTFETDQTLLVDANRDLALIKINTTGLPYVTLGDSTKVEVGDPVVAIGSPLGYENTVSNGLISGVRHFEEDKLDYIQTSAPITNGSSGGALFNSNGEVIGVTTLAYPYGGEINFAIPSKDVIKFLSQTKHPQSITAVIAAQKEKDDPSKDQHKDYDTITKIEDKLNEEFSAYTNPLTGTQDKLKFYVDFDYDDYDSETGTLNIEMSLESTSLYNYLTGDFAQQNSKRTSDLLGKVLKMAHDEGGKHLTITFYYDSKSRKFSTLFPGDYAHFQQGTGYYKITHVFAWAALDDKTGDMTYLVQPGQNDVVQHAKLFTP